MCTAVHLYCSVHYIVVLRLVLYYRGLSMDMNIIIIPYMCRMPGLCATFGGLSHMIVSVNAPPFT